VIRKGWTAYAAALTAAVVLGEVANVVQGSLDARTPANWVLSAVLLVATWGYALHRPIGAHRYWGPAFWVVLDRHRAHAAAGADGRPRGEDRGGGAAAAAGPGLLRCVPLRLSLAGTLAGAGGIAMTTNPMSPAAVQQVIAQQFPGLLGIELVETTPERVVGRLRARPEICTVGGMMHGGAVMGFADTLGAVGTFLNMPPGATTTTTIESSTKFMAAAPAGQVLTGESVPLHRGRTTMVWQTSIRREDGRLCALVLQTQLMMEPKAAPAA
jgi:1,4-dihydroxy-2-naphthoyl-CoA hydrolase